MTTPELIRLAFMFYVAACVMTIITFIGYLLFACAIGLWDNRHKKDNEEIPYKEMHVEERDAVEVEEVV